GGCVSPSQLAMSYWPSFQSPPPAPSHGANVSRAFGRVDVNVFWLKQLPSVEMSEPADASRMSATRLSLSTLPITQFCCASQRIGAPGSVGTCCFCCSH